MAERIIQQRTAATVTKRHVFHGCTLFTVETPNGVKFGDVAGWCLESRSSRHPPGARVTLVPGARVTRVL